MISKVQPRMSEGNTKFGVVISVTGKESLELNRINRSTLWEDIIKKEYEDVQVDFKLSKEKEKVHMCLLHLKKYL